MDYIKYEVEISILDRKVKIFVPVGIEIPLDLHDQIIRDEVSHYIKRATRVSYSQLIH